MSPHLRVTRTMKCHRITVISSHHFLIFQKFFSKTAQTYDFIHQNLIIEIMVCNNFQKALPVRKQICKPLSLPFRKRGDRIILELRIVFLNKFLKSFPGWNRKIQNSARCRIPPQPFIGMSTGNAITYHPVCKRSAFNIGDSLLYLSFQYRHHLF